MASISQAVPAATDSIDYGVAWHYGDPLGEQRKLVAQGGLVDLSQLGVIAVTGSDRLSWLQDLTTQKLTAIQSGGSALALVLDPKGHVEFELRVIEDGATTWLVVEPSQIAAIISYLDSMRFMLDVAVADRTDDWAALWVAVPASKLDEVEDIAATLRIDSIEPLVWNPPLEFLGLGDTEAGSDRGGAATKYVPERPGVLAGALVLVPRASLVELLADRDDLAGTWALEALRVAAGIPRSILDGDYRALPHELGLIGPAVHLAKGCYRGQETVARVHNMGKPPRRLTLLHLDGSAGEVPNLGADIRWNGRAIGRSGTVAQHYELGPISLGIIKRSVPLLDPLEVAVGDAEAVAGAIGSEHPNRSAQPVESTWVAATQQAIVVA